MKGSFVMLRDKIVEAIEEVGFDEYGEIKTSELIFTQAVFDSCAACENYGKNYTCPPHSGTMSENQNRYLQYENCIVINKILDLGQYYELMESSGKDFGERIDRLRTLLKEYPVMVTGPGGCTICKTCAVIEEKPCRFPDQKHFSMEGSGLDIITLSRNLKMTYNGGNHKLGFFMAVMY